MKKPSVKNLAAILMCCVLLAGIAACRSETPQKSTTPTPTPSAQAQSGGEQTQTPASEPAAEIISDGYPEKLRIFCGLWGSNIGHETNNEVGAWQEITRRTGTEIEWIHPAEGTTEAVNLLIASGDLPDIIQTNWRDIAGGAGSYAKDGAIIRLNELMDNEMPYYSSYIDMLGARYQLEFDGGDIYYITTMQIEPDMLTVIGPTVRREWLEELIIPVPKTVDDVYNMLVAFKNKYPDIYPMTGYGASSKKSNFHIEGHMWPWGTSIGFYQVDGTVTFGPMTGEFEQAVTWLAKCASEGLLDKEWVSQSRSEVDAKFMAGQAGYEIAIQSTRMNTTMEGQNFTAMGIPYISLTEGGPAYVMNSRYVDFLQATGSAAITTACKEPEKTARWFDFIFSPEGQLITNYGIEGESYTMVNGTPTFTESFLSIIGEQQFRYIFGTATSFPSVRLWGGYAPTLHSTAVESITNWTSNMDTSRVLPNLQLSGSQTDIINDILTDVTTYVEEQFAGLVNGNIPLSDIPAMRDRISGMGIQKVIDVYQEVYDRIK